MNLNEFQKAANTTAIYPGRNEPLGLVYTALKLNGEAGEYAEKLGKLIRDAQVSHIPEDSREAMARELGDVLWYVAMAAFELGFSLDEVATMNLEKLADRQARGALGGSGDER